MSQLQRTVIVYHFQSSDQNAIESPWVRVSFLNSSIFTVSSGTPLACSRGWLCELAMACEFGQGSPFGSVPRRGTQKAHFTLRVGPEKNPS
jgi:hypothetical protein